MDIDIPKEGRHRKKGKVNVKTRAGQEMKLRKNKKKTQSSRQEANTVLYSEDKQRKSYQRSWLTRTNVFKKKKKKHTKLCHTRQTRARSVSIMLKSYRLTS